MCARLFSICLVRVAGDHLSYKFFHQDMQTSDLRGHHRRSKPRSLFSFDVGFARGTATGGEPAVISTAPANQEIHIGQCSQFRVPQVPGW